MSLQQRFADAMGGLLGPDFPSDIGLAVSGGGDSMAMLTLAHNWTRVWGVRLWVVTVDHGLRAESAAEAALVAEECAALGHPHATLRWHWDGQGNKMAAARDARIALIDAWRGTLEHVLMAHTRDDVAETFLMRLKRGSGVDGLSAMAAKRVIARHPTQLNTADVTGDLPQQWGPRKGMMMSPAQFHVVRPCLDMTRAELRHYLRTLQGRWVEDPSNDDPAYDRILMRQAQGALDALGLDIHTLAHTAGRMARARDSLRLRAAEAFGRLDVGGYGTRETGDILMDRDGFAALDGDTQLRLLAGALQFVSSQPFRPRAAPLEALLDRALSGGGGTLHGCEVRMAQSALHIFREFKAIADPILLTGNETLWDGRWRIYGAEGWTLRALGEDGWGQVADKPPEAPPFHAARSLPSLWEGHTLKVCKPLGLDQERQGPQLWPMGREMLSFTAFLLSH